MWGFYRWSKLWTHIQSLEFEGISTTKPCSMKNNNWANRTTSELLNGSVGVLLRLSIMKDINWTAQVLNHQSHPMKIHFRLLTFYFADQHFEYLIFLVFLKKLVTIYNPVNCKFKMGKRTRNQYGIITYMSKFVCIFHHSDVGNRSMHNGPQFRPFIFKMFNFCNYMSFIASFKSHLTCQPSVLQPNQTPVFQKSSVPELKIGGQVPKCRLYSGLILRDRMYSDRIWDTVIVHIAQLMIPLILESQPQVLWTYSCLHSWTFVPRHPDILPPQPRP
jgi:hypothetical protein